MQSQRLAKSVSQAMIGNPAAFPEVKESGSVLANTVPACTPATTSSARCPAACRTPSTR